MCVAAMPPKQESQYTVVALCALQPEADLLAETKAWLTGHGVHEQLVHIGRANLQQSICYHARCVRHVDCSWAWRFSIASPAVFEDVHLPQQHGDRFMLVQSRGFHSEVENVKKVRKSLCHQYALSETPSRVQRAWSERGIPIASQPSAVSLKNRRARARAAVSVCCGAAFIGSRRAFIDAPPPRIRIDTTRSVVSAESLCIIVLTPESLLQACVYAAKREDIKLGMDGTFNTDAQHLILTVTGPLGLCIGADTVTVRCSLAVCVLSAQEHAGPCGRALAGWNDFRNRDHEHFMAG